MDSEGITVHHECSGPERSGTHFNGEDCRIPSCSNNSISEARITDFILTENGVTNYPVSDLMDTEVLPVEV